MSRNSIHISTNREIGYPGGRVLQKSRIFLPTEDGFQLLVPGDGFQLYGPGGPSRF